MKTTISATVAAVALSALIGGSALAQTAQAAQPGRGLRADADNDGRVSRAEFVDGRIARLTALDADRDGSITAEEGRAAIQARRAERVSARFAALDDNGDGALSREEFAAPRDPRADRGDHGGRQRMGGRRGGPRGAWSGHGGGHGGGRGWGDRAEARGPIAIAEVQTRLTTQFDRLDADRDGFVTVEERRAARDAMRDQRREHRAARPASPSAAASE